MLSWAHFLVEERPPFVLGGAWKGNTLACTCSTPPLPVPSGRCSRFAVFPAASAPLSCLLHLVPSCSARSSASLFPTRCSSVSIPVCTVYCACCPSVPTSRRFVMRFFSRVVPSLSKLTAFLFAYFLLGIVLTVSAIDLPRCC